MRIGIELKTAEIVKIPIHYNYYLQSFIYRHLSPLVAERFHNKGVEYQKRIFKLYTFSKILTRLEKIKEFFRVEDKIYFEIASPFNELLQDLGTNLLKVSDVSIAGTHFSISGINVRKPLDDIERLDFIQLSPITVYSTLQKADGEKKVYYYSPQEREFTNMVHANLLKKYAAFYGVDYNGKLEFKTIKVGAHNHKVLKYMKNKEHPTVIKAWEGLYRILAEPEMIRLAYDCGLGSKNSQGFGMMGALH